MSLAMAGAWLWETFGGKVVERAGQHGGEAARGLWQRIDWQRAAEQYRGEMQRLHGTMRIIGMTEPVALADVFTDVYILDKPSAWRRHNIEELIRRQQLDQQERDKADVRRDAVEVVRGSERLFILGKPGAGKSTLLKHLVLQATRGNLDAIPIFVGLKAWSDSGLALMPFLVKQFAICAFPDAQPFIEAILADGRALLLFDGLDEVNVEGQARERITREVRDFADQYARSHSVMTCRTAATDYQFEQFSYCELADFTEQQARTLASNWFGRNEVKRDAFLAEFAKPEHKGLRDLARTPLLLALLCIAFDETMHFPPRRVEVYEEALDALLKKWDSSRQIHRDEAYKKLALGRKRELLTQIGYKTFERGELFLRQDDLAQQIEEYLRTLPPTNSTEDIDGVTVLHAIEAQHGLLIERSLRIHSFSHLTFQEYFAARHIAAHPSPAMFQSVIAHADDVRWREVLLLVTSMLDGENALAFFDSFDVSLRRMIEVAPPVQALMRWVARKAQGAAEGEQLAARMSYLTLALVGTVSSSGLARDLAVERARALDCAHIHARTHALALARARGRARALAQDLASALALDGAQDLARARARALTSALARALAQDLARALAQDLARALAQDLDLSTMGTSSQEEAAWVGRLLQISIIATSNSIERTKLVLDELTNDWHAAIAAAPEELRATLGTLVPPAADAPDEDWLRVERDLRVALQAHLDIGHDWAMGEPQFTLLSRYLESSTCLLECLDLAALPNRDALRNRLLLP